MDGGFLSRSPKWLDSVVDDGIRSKISLSVFFFSPRFSTHSSTFILSPRFFRNTDKMTDQEKIPIALAGIAFIALPFIAGLIALYSAK